MSINTYTIAAYIRLSVKDDDIDSLKRESDSVANQRALIKNYIKSNRDFDNAVYIEFIDDGYIGADFNRPQLRKMLGEVKAGKINCIIVKDFSRLGRDYVKVGDLLEYTFPFLNVRFISISDNYDSRDFQSTPELEVGFQNIINELYSRDLSDKVRNIKEMQTKKGMYTSGLTPYGYKKSSNEKNKLIIDNEAAETVKRIFSMKLEGKRLFEIAKTFNAEGIPSPSAYKKRKIPKENCLWNEGSVSRILKNEVYLGKIIVQQYKKINIQGAKNKKMKMKKIVTENAHEPIIDEQTFNTVNAKKRLPHKAVKRRLYSGKLKCGVCGHTFCSNIREEYFCRASKCFVEPKCYNGTVKESFISETVLKEFNAIIKSGEKNETVKSVEERQKKDHKKEISVLKKRIEVLNGKKFLLFEKYAQNIISSKDYIDKNSELDKEIEKSQTELNSYVLRKNQNKSKLYKNMETAKEVTREFIENTVDVIYVRSDGSIEIKWKRWST